MEIYYNIFYDSYNTKNYTLINKYWMNKQHSYKNH